MFENFRKTSLDYNLGFTDGILWAVENRNKIGFDEIIALAENILKANDDIINEDAKRFEQLQKTKIKTE